MLLLAKQRSRGSHPTATSRQPLLPHTVAAKANSTTGAERARGAPRPGREPAHARGGLHAERQGNSPERERACASSAAAECSPTPAYVLTLSPRAVRLPPPGGPNAFGQRGAPDRKWPLRPSAPVRRKRLLLLTASKIASGFSKAPAEKRTRSGAVKRLPPAFVAFLSLICQTPSAKVSPSGLPAFSEGGGGPWGRRPGSEAAGPAPPEARATSRGSSRDVTPLLPASGGGAPYAPCGRAGSAGVPPGRAVTGAGRATSERAGATARAGDHHGGVCDALGRAPAVCLGTFH